MYLFAIQWPFPTLSVSYCTPSLPIGRSVQVTEVLCTTVAEALAMGKWVVCSRHPSNEFFFQFPNCLPFTTEEDFAACVSWALRHDPEELTQELRFAKRTCICVYAFVCLLNFS